MGRMVDIDDIVTMEGIAERYGITRQAVNLWTRKPDFPAPVAGVRFGRLWLFPDVAAWRDAQPPRPQRIEHGTKNRYNGGCRCDECKEANTEWTRRRREKLKPLAAGDPRHGTQNGYKNWACRCWPCKAAGSEGNRANRERRLARRNGAA